HGRELLLNNGSVHELWNLATGKKVLELQGTKFTGGDPECASRGSTLLADCPWLGEGALTPRVCDLQSQRILFHLPQGAAAPSCFAWSTNQELLAVGLPDGELAIWNLPRIKAQLDDLGLGWSLVTKIPRNRTESPRRSVCAPGSMSLVVVAQAGAPWRL